MYEPSDDIAPEGWFIIASVMLAILAILTIAGKQ
jgi:hypothetical protein